MCAPFSTQYRLQCSRLTSSSSCVTSSLHPRPPPAHCRCRPFSSSSSSVADPRQSHRWQTRPRRLLSYAWREREVCCPCCVQFNLESGDDDDEILSVLTLTRPPPPPPPFFLSLAISFDPSAKVSRFLVFSTYKALCSRSFFCSSTSLLRFSS